MKFSTLSLGFLALLTPLTAAWSKEVTHMQFLDQEIFRIRDEVALHEGPDVSFYDVLGVAASASHDEISRAYRKRTQALHPDKVKRQLMAEKTTKSKDKSKDTKDKKKSAVKPPSQSEIKAAIKAADEKQARLGVIAGILRGSSRARYDHFMSNGFPTWKGTGYYYNRYRPGLGTVLVGCFLAGGGLFHYVALYMSWRRQREFVDRYIKYARNAAWGENVAIPGVDAGAPSMGTATPPAIEDEQAPMMAMNRKQRRMQERDSKRENSKENRRMGRGRAGKPASGSATPVPQTQAGNGSGPTGAKKRVVAENGKVLVVDSLGDVYLEQQDEEGNMHEFLLDVVRQPNELPKPSIRDTAVFQLPIWAYSATVGRALGSKQDAFEEQDLAEEVAQQLVEDDSSSDAPQRTPSSDSAEDYEMVDTSKSVEDLAKKATGSQSQSSKAKKRNSKKR
ncbi:DnaJ domain-containing protein [Apiospora phragmitis]|uniref:DnaJ domain-containing protein n=1 Tax=Apiospora phragmitis TaxID=2905665 RepID=A0ABR1TV03_9PEZI